MLYGYILVLSAVVVFSTAHKLQVGTCPEVTPMENFELQKFLGEWYPIYRVKADSSCIKDTWSVNEDQEIDLIVDKFADVGLDSFIRLRSKILSTGNPATFKIKHARFLPKTNLQVLDTDYENYALIYKCQPIFPVYRWSASILARNQTFSDADITDELLKKLKDEGLDISLMNVVSHDGCKTPEEADFSVDIEGEDLSADISGKYVESIKKSFNSLSEVFGREYREAGDEPQEIANRK